MKFYTPLILLLLAGTPLTAMVKKRNPNKRRVVNTKSSEHIENIMEAIPKCSLGEVEYLYNTRALDLSATNIDGTDLLSVVAGAHRNDIVEFFLSKGANCQTRNFMGQSALMHAIKTSPTNPVGKIACFKTLELLVEAGDSWDIPDTSGKTAYDYASPEIRDCLDSFKISKKKTVKRINYLPEIKTPSPPLQRPPNLNASFVPLELPQLASNTRRIEMSRIHKTRYGTVVTPLPINRKNNMKKLAK
ncbi:MAG TPA: ankyrin repeat domain-containing protein [Candidatus Babeliales bacterium]|nr:ankyrin repeat domain-containing protein [Candidatus Babeliales bacterium]